MDETNFGVSFQFMDSIQETLFVRGSVWCIPSPRACSALHHAGKCAGIGKRLILGMHPGSPWPACLPQPSLALNSTS